MKLDTKVRFMSNLGRSRIELGRSSCISFDLRTLSMDEVLLTKCLCPKRHLEAICGVTQNSKI